MAIHHSLTGERLLAAAMDDSGIGFCIECGEEASGCEPDARNYECESCGKKKVFGAEELVILVARPGGL